jgi:hypothetical protein
LVPKEALKAPKAVYASTSGETLGESIRRTLRILVIATIILYLIIGGLAIYSFSLSKANTRGLCALRADAQDRIDQSEAFLKEHPKGIPGISVQQLQRSTDNSRRTAKSLKGLTCPPPEVIK